MSTYAIDFESYYDKKISLKVMGVDQYLEATDIYMVSIVGDDGLSWVGHPDDAPWHKLHGHIWLSHNRSFDERVYDHIKKKWAGFCSPREWHCTADLVAYFGIPRSLAAACAHVLGIKVDKTVRDNMSGKRWEEMDADFREEVSQYALVDSERCLQLWKALGHLWPEQERRLSRLTTEMCWRGVTTDTPKLLEGIENLKRVRWEAQNSLPWVTDEESTVLSLKNLAVACREAGIEPPTSLAMDSEECAAWEAKYGKDFIWVEAMRTYRRSNALLKKLEVMRDRTRAEDGRMGYGMKYFGASTTGRWSGDAGFNPQNLHKEVMWGVDIRGLIVPAPGKKFIIADLSQIEPRCLSWMIGDEPFLDGVRQGMSPYEVHARNSMGWTGGSLKENDKKRYALAKARVLSLGYGAGWEKFIAMADMYNALDCFKEPVTPRQREDFVEYLEFMSGSPGNKTKYLNLLSEFDHMAEVDQRVWVNSWLQVNDFRATNPLIADKEKGVWKRLEMELRCSIGKNHSIELPSGRFLRYRNVSGRGGSLSADMSKNGVWARTKLYGGLLTENITQACARDVFGVIKLNLVDAGFDQIVLTVHDEVVLEVDLSVTPEEILSIMRKEPEWIEGLPLDAEAFDAEYYQK